MGRFLSAILSWLLGVFTRGFGLVAAHFTASKIVMVALVIIVLPIILNNFLYEIMGYAFDAATNYADAQGLDETINPVIQFTGVAAYLLDEMGIVAAISVVLSCMAIRFAMTWIPFVGPK